MPQDPALAQLPPMEALLALMARLRDPVSGCPWDLEQTWSTIAPYTVEEAYEVADAIERGDPADLRDELGDLLFQVVFHARIAEEEGIFSFDDVARAITDKMIRRHPHVFGDAEQRTAEGQTVAWEAQKAAERAARGQDRSQLLDDIPAGLPAMTRAVKLTRRAARVGFDWTHIRDVTEKLREELAELEVEIAADDRQKAQDELGDLLFVCANLARKLDIDPEHALRGANAKFTRRFRHIEDRLTAAGTPLADAGLDAMEALWDEAKRIERGLEPPVDAA